MTDFRLWVRAHSFCARGKSGSTRVFRSLEPFGGKRDAWPTSGGYRIKPWGVMKAQKNSVGVNRRHAETHFIGRIHLGGRLGEVQKLLSGTAVPGVGERGRCVMAKRDLLKLPDDFEANMRALLSTPPAPHGTARSRKTAPKPPTKPKKKAKNRRYAKPAPTGTYAYENAPVVTRKRKATKKR